VATGIRLTSLAALVIVAIGRPAAAQSPAPNRARPLMINSSAWESVEVSSKPRPLITLDSTTTSSPSSWSVAGERSLQALLNGMSANRGLRAADAAVGITMVALASGRGRALPPPAIAVGVEAIRLGISRDLPAPLRRYAIEPHVERGGFSITVTRKYR